MLMTGGGLGRHTLLRAVILMRGPRHLDGAGLLRMTAGAGEAGACIAAAYTAAPRKGEFEIFACYVGCLTMLGILLLPGSPVSLLRADVLVEYISPGLPNPWLTKTDATRGSETSLYTCLTVPPGSREYHERERNPEPKEQNTFFTFRNLESGSLLSLPSVSYPC